MTHYFYHSARFILAVFFLLLGAICLILPSSGEVLRKIIPFLLENRWILFILALFFLAIAFLILLDINVQCKKKSYIIKAGNRSLMIDEKIFDHYLEAYWKELFPKNRVESKATIKKNKLYVTAELPNVEMSQQKQLVGQIENDLNELLFKTLGYDQQYILSITFRA